MSCRSTYRPLIGEVARCQREAGHHGLCMDGTVTWASARHEDEVRVAAELDGLADHMAVQVRDKPHLAIHVVEMVRDRARELRGES